MRRLFAGVILSFLLIKISYSSVLHEGDIVFQTSRSSQSLAVQRATASRYSHMGIIFYRKGDPYVLEAVSKVKYTPFNQWVARGVRGDFVIKRLKDADKILTSGALARLRQEAEKFAGREYDLTFEWSDNKIYCSELVWKAYQRSLGIEIGKLQKIKDFNLSDPNVQAKIRERYGSQVPLMEPVISPVAMYDSPLLVTVEIR